MTRSGMYGLGPDPYAAGVFLVGPKPMQNEGCRR